MKHKYCVKIRFSSEYSTQKEWLPVSWHEKIEDAKSALEWQLKHGGECTQAQIFAI